MVDWTTGQCFTIKSLYKIWSVALANCDEPSTDIRLTSIQITKMKTTEKLKPTRSAFEVYLSVARL